MPGTVMIPWRSTLCSPEWTWTATYTGPSPTGPVTNRRVSGRGAAVARTEDGKIAHFTDYYDVASFYPREARDSVPK
jgi:hypothetical protein